eukprot:GILK01002390.1.p1 GENE.GILK01002390.1~~GILK01002390.1.p1  ORF type:complete len:261 (+),score=43.21 GILK01002390.1:483-1265(+)
MRFRENWDDMLIQDLKLCNSPKPILTSYPVGYELPNKIPSETRSSLLCARNFDSKDGMLRISGKLLASIQREPIHSLFWASGFSFSDSRVIQEVPYDPFLKFLFFGEEMSMAVRLYTNGWDFFAPRENICYHLWSRAYRPTFRQLRDVNGLERVSQRRARTLLQQEPFQTIPAVTHDAPADSKVGSSSTDSVSDSSGESNTESLGVYGLGTVRTLQQYEDMSGVHFRNRSLDAHALQGGQSPQAFNDFALSLLAKMAAQF